MSNKLHFGLSLLALTLLAGCTPRNSVPSTENKPSESTNSQNPTPTPANGDGIRVSYVNTKSNLIRAEVVVKDWKASAVHFDEVQVLSTAYAAVSDKTADGNDNLVAVSASKDKDGHAVTSVYGKYINFNGKVYTADVTGEAGAQKVAYYKDASKTTSLDAELKALTETKDIAEAFHAIANGYAFASDATGVKLATALPVVSKQNANSTYWPLGGYKPLGWKGNIEKIEKALTGKDLRNVAVSTNKSSDGKTTTYAVDSVDTGATITSFSKYVDAAKAAFDGSSKVVEYFHADMIENRAKGNGHAPCIAKVELVVGADKKVQKAFLNETVENLTEFATVADGFTGETVDYKYKGKHGPVSGKASKFVKVNDVLFTAASETNDENASVTQAVIYSANGINDHYAYFGEGLDLDGTNRSREFYNTVFEHKVELTDKDGKKLADMTLADKTATKAENGCTYWVKSEKYPLGWQRNIAEVEKAFEGVDFSSAAATKKDDTTKKWTINNVETGATMTEFETFATFANRAYAYLIA
jgi:hypothetical protein